jgi:hypothetical protein
MLRNVYDLSSLYLHLLFWGLPALFIISAISAAQAFKRSFCSGVIATHPTNAVHPFVDALPIILSG